MRRWLLATMLAMLLSAGQRAPGMPVLRFASAAELARAGACVAVAADPAASLLYQATTGAAGLSGELAAYALQQDAAGRPVIGGQPLWKAAAQLDARDPATRKLYTGQDDGARLRTIPLAWQALDGAQRLLLSAEGSMLPGPQLLAYLRGERTLEKGRPGGMLRQRDSLLGAAVVGAPIFVAAAAATSVDAGRAAFAAAAARRPATVYLQTNDGMLHGFDAASGAELFAYLPQALQPAWPRLTGAAHAASPYAEGAIAAADALVGGAWKTVLAGALGGAAQGLFVLDVSDPSRFAEGGGVLFEFTDRNDPDIGNLFNAPAIARFRTGINSYGDFVVAASGYNNYRADGEGRYNQAGAGVLFLLSLDREPSSPWQLGRNYFKFALPAASQAQANGLAQPALTAHADGSVQAAYAGDLQGQVWRLGFSAAPPWAQQDAAPLFAAHDAAGRRQPITMPLRAVHGQQGLLLLFGTGRLLEAADADDKSAQTLYAVSDLVPDPPANRALLAARQRVADAGGGYRLEGNAVAPLGWLLDLPLPGERMIASPALADGNLVFATLQPGAAACAPAGGLYRLDALSGLPPASVATPWLGQIALPGRTLALAPGAPDRRAITAPGAVPRDAVLGGGAGQPVPSIVRKSRAGRLGWREVVDWEASGNAVPQK